jgi:hypothetical protein
LAGLEAIVDLMMKFSDKSGLIYRAKHQEYLDLNDELSKMNVEYNELIGVIYADASQKDKRDQLVAKFDNPAVFEFYIDGNLDALGKYEDRLNTLGDQTDDKDYVDYREIESNVAKIKTAICLEIGKVDQYDDLAQTEKSLKDMVAELRGALTPLQEANAVPQNPDFLENEGESDDFLTNDFGLFQN